MQHVSNDTRRATTDFDLDFVRFSIADDSIRKFIGALSDGSSTFSIRMTGKIEQLKHQDYSGKRIHVVISDAQGSSIETKVDIGVHNLVSPDRELDDAVRALVIEDPTMRERSYGDIANRLSRVFGDRRFKRELSRAKNNWLEISPDKVTSAITAYFS